MHGLMAQVIHIGTGNRSANNKNSYNSNKNKFLSIWCTDKETGSCMNIVLVRQELATSSSVVTNSNGPWCLPPLCPCESV
jgi:hypothetical protein